MRSLVFLWAAFRGAHISGFTRVTVISEHFSGCEYFSRIEVIFSEASFLAHRLFTTPASRVVTLGPFFSSSTRPTLSSVRNSSLTSVWESIVAHGSVFDRSSFTSSTDTVTLIASISLFEVLCLGEEFSSGSEEDALWCRFRPLVLELGRSRFSRASYTGRCSHIRAKSVVNLPKSALNFTTADCMLSSWPGGWFFWLSGPEFWPSGRTGAVISMPGWVFTRARHGGKLSNGKEIVRFPLTKKYI